MLTISCPVASSRMVLGETCYPLSALTPWGKAASGDVVGILLDLGDQVSVGQDWNLRFARIDPTAEAGLFAAYIDSLDAAEAGRLAPAALRLIQDSALSAALTSAAREMDSPDTDLLALVTAAGALVFPSDDWDYDHWVTRSLADGPDDMLRAQEHIHRLVQLVRIPAPSAHAAIAARSTLAELLAWHDARVAAYLDEAYHFRLRLPDAE